MYIPPLTAPLLYALLSLNPAAVTSLANLPAGGTVARQVTSPSPSASLVNATVSCREGEFQDPDLDIVNIVCLDYYQCGGGSEAERLDPDGQGGQIAVWTAECVDCKADQPPNRASGCVYTPI
ncbi:hypothetical protein BP5796_03563 [Coleophoma crateriformis]|uniref:Uncharacterized protein n=1 Tax=Coleophoma crateriformis TaxID=565419 RepID=A0A3D8SNF9_9HELO|nr:hypothetical protein BP5796_03563 [Coleophoma crateriformis]